ncbi:hypothetical protein A2368_03015 [Candidatus Collierbacteria bacterium RIFOXYB1_FULL_49_13]|uniref:Uncharacterized protein n=1 Tax=Candidatus Collierbacteria bacterium RIFOXYB1_FULL_49_13 TaxID=1817728 RepID=A0A1F5FKK2_9BACT|nr:MAG: hypothetical protein A2368_03015 [Candidatus Collierbacteria bacterium RIFOXYB1_FULL_49_13]
MGIIKEVAGELVVLRADNYSHSLAHIHQLFEEAKRDFPKLKDSDVLIVHYSGSAYARTFGIEFPLPPGIEAPATYTRITTLETTF